MLIFLFTGTWGENTRRKYNVSNLGLFVWISDQKPGTSGTICLKFWGKFNDILYPCIPWYLVSMYSMISCIHVFHDFLYLCIPWYLVFMYSMIYCIHVFHDILYPCILWYLVLSYIHVFYDFLYPCILWFLVSMHSMIFCIHVFIRGGWCCLPASLVRWTVRLQLFTLIYDRRRFRPRLLLTVYLIVVVYGLIISKGLTYMSTLCTINSLPLEFTVPGLYISKGLAYMSDLCTITSLEFTVPCIYICKGLA